MQHTPPLQLKPEQQSEPVSHAMPDPEQPQRLPVQVFEQHSAADEHPCPFLVQQEPEEHSSPVQQAAAPQASPGAPQVALQVPAQLCEQQSE